MKTRNLIFTALTALALSALAGCSSETELPQEAPDVIPEGMARIEFAIKGVKTGSSYAASPTVGLDPVERQINDVTAYLFKLPEGQAAIADTDPVDEVVATTVADGKASFLMPVAAVEGDRFAVVLIGNKACFDVTALAAVTKGSTYAALNAVATQANTYIIANLLNGGLPMSALTAITIPNGGGKVTVDARFSRPLARFDINNQARHSFTITSVVLKNGRTTSPLNVPATAGKVLGSPTDVDYSEFITNVNKELTPPDLNPDGSNTKLRPAFYASPALDTDGASLVVKGMLRSGLSEFPAEYAVPLVNKTTKAPIVIAANKRYRVTLSMDKDNNFVGEVTIDLGEWEDNDPVNPDVTPDLNYQVGTINPTPEVTYKVETQTFTVFNTVKSFRFEMINDMGVKPVIPANDLVVGVNRVANVNTRAAKVVFYEVMLRGEEGTGSFSFTTEEGKEYKFNVDVIVPPTTPYPGFTEPAVLVGDVYWAPANVGAKTINEPGTLFQYGRSTGWSSAQAMLDSRETGYDEYTLTFAESETTYAGKSFVESDLNWWSESTDSGIQTMLANWAAVSDGVKNPCPSGWRIPTKEQMGMIAKLPVSASGDVSVGVTKITINDIPFIRKESLYIVSMTNHVVVMDRSNYMTTYSASNKSVPVLIFDPDGSKGMFEKDDMGGNYGDYIRCIKDK